MYTAIHRSRQKFVNCNKLMWNTCRIFDHQVSDMLLFLLSQIFRWTFCTHRKWKCTPVVAIFCFSSLWVFSASISCRVIFLIMPAEHSLEPEDEGCSRDFGEGILCTDREFSNASLMRKQATLTVSLSRVPCKWNYKYTSGNLWQQLASILGYTSLCAPQKTDMELALGWYDTILFIGFDVEEYAVNIIRSV